jgi:hypothetical protein
MLYNNGNQSYFEILEGTNDEEVIQIPDSSKESFKKIPKKDNYTLNNNLDYIDQ